MKICMLTTSFPLTQGDYAGHFVKRVARELVAIGHSVTILAPGAPNSPAHETLDGLRVIRFSYFPYAAFQCLAYGEGIMPNIRKKRILVFLIPFFLASFTRHAVRLARSCDVVHAHWSVSAFPGLWCRRIHNTPVVVSLRGSDFSDTGNRVVNSATDWILKRVDGVITENESLRRKAWASGVADNRLVSIHNGVGLDIFIPNRSRDILKGTPAATAERVLLFVGRLSHVKGPDIALQAFQSIYSRHPGAVLLMAGKGAMLEELSRYCLHDAGLKDRVLFLGEVDHRRMPLYYNASDLLVISSRSEGVPNALLEAMACGLPAVATPVGGIPQVVDDGQTGFVLGNVSADTLGKRLNDILKNPIRLRNAGKRARMWAERHLDWTAVAHRYLRFYETVLKRPA